MAVWNNIRFLNFAVNEPSECKYIPTFPSLGDVNVPDFDVHVSWTPVASITWRLPLLDLLSI